jgi:hydrogenase-4 transcriptional activator
MASNGLLLSIWREACRHIEIAESTATLAPMLAEHLPLDLLLVRRFDPAAAMIETMAAGGQRVSTPTATRTAVSPAQMNRLLAWARSGQLADSTAAPRRGELALVVPPELAGAVVAGPLGGPDGPAGALVLASEHASFEPQHLQLVEQLLEPFGVALENDRRLRELAALRAAAEADRRTLLSRLGRETMAEPIVGADSGLRHVMQRVELVAHSDVPVLILGETGTGKEVVSRAIHSRSARAAAPFIRVNCGAIPPELIDSQLFGHERGSFTGAAETRAGWFERADHGTLFLDEIGELPLAAQVRLLRVLQDGYIERVGGKQPLRVDVRIVAATHRDLASMVKERTFREDLWYRINVFPLLLPRLSERIEDIPALARHFAQRAAHRFGLAPAQPTPSDLQLLISYPWPGNIRELGAVIDRAAILGAGQRLDVATALGQGWPAASPLPASRPPSTLPTLYEVIPDPPAIQAPAATTPAPADGPLATLDEAMKRHIVRALVAAAGRVEGRRGAAALLGINPHTLRARMRKLGIDWAGYRSSD